MKKWKKEELTDRIISACINVHKELGPGFLEKFYRNALKIELKKLGLSFESEKEFCVFYQGALIGVQRLDLLVENEVILELKAVKEISGHDYAQLRSYLKAADKEIGLLINFAKSKIDIRRVEEKTN